MRGTRALPKPIARWALNDSAILRLNYPRNTIEVDEAVNTLRVQKMPVRAITHVRLLSGRRKIHQEDARPLSRESSSPASRASAALARRGTEAIGPALHGRGPVTQVVPAVSGYSSAVLEYKNALAEIFCRRSARLRVAGRFCCSQHPDRRDQARRPADLILKSWSIRWRRPAISIWASACRSISAAPNTPPLKRSGTALDECGRFQPVDLE